VCVHGETIKQNVCVIIVNGEHVSSASLGGVSDMLLLIDYVALDMLS